MTKLNQEELAWIKDRLKIYKIKYVEIHDEIYDHIISAIEQKRMEGSQCELAHLFQDIIDDDFNNHRGIEKMTNERVRTANNILSASLKRELSHYLSLPKSLLLMGCIAILSWIFSILTLTPWENFILIIIMSYLPSCYVMWFEIKNKKFRKKSIASGYMNNITGWPTTIIYLSLYLLPLLMTQFLEVNPEKNFTLEGMRITMGFIGPIGVSILFVLISVFSFAVEKVIQTEYKKMITN